MTLLTFSLVILVTSAVLLIIRHFVIHTATNTANAVTVETLQLLFPNTLIGKAVAYKKQPSRPFGTICYIDRNQRARIHRYNGDYVRRSLTNLVVLEMEDQS